MKLAVIGGRDPVIGFSLAGVKQRYLVNSQEEAETALNLCLQDQDIGIILIEDLFAMHLTARLRALKKTRQIYPIILSLPGRE
ncbi:MAG: hypothetical protein CVV33_07415 [Methanomicrobiales archaeon HGW-Methanomicrobiales-4]|nr:MAG: hypothetical protein CVV33_07415 [Methanomicrobiales archaeon HGW-Methanomicrobiales-4]